MRSMASMNSRLSQTWLPVVRQSIPRSSKLSADLARQPRAARRVLRVGDAVVRVVALQRGAAAPFANDLTPRPPTMSPMTRMFMRPRASPAPEELSENARLLRAGRTGQTPPERRPGC